MEVDRLKIEIQEIENGFVVTLFDDSAPSDTDKTFHTTTMGDALDAIVNYYETILAWRKTVEED